MPFQRQHETQQKSDPWLPDEEEQGCPVMSWIDPSCVCRFPNCAEQRTANCPYPHSQRRQQAYVARAKEKQSCGKNEVGAHEARTCKYRRGKIQGGTCAITGKCFEQRASQEESDQKR